MVTYADLIDETLTRLSDNGTIFTRAEILRWLSEGYRRLTNQSQHAKIFTALDTPPRHYTAITHPWEGRYSPGPYRKWTYTHRSGLRECTFLWEAQQDAGVDTSNQDRNVSNLWELSSGEGEVDAHYRFILPENQSNIHTVWHDHEKLTALTASTLDTLEDRWWSVDGEIFAWTKTLGDASSFEVFEIDTTYQQAYDHRDFENGLPRGFSGDRTYSVSGEVDSWGYAYAWEGEPAAPTDQLDGIGRSFTIGSFDGYHYTHEWEGQQHRNETVSASTSIVETNPFRVDSDGAETITSTLELGIPRRIISASRQYFPSPQWSCLGIPRVFGSSEDNILVYHSVNAETATTEDEELELIPDQVAKYLMFYALSVLFNRQGQGYDPAVAGHYAQRSSRGVALLNRLANITRIAESYVRDSPSSRSRSRASLPRLPSNFARAPWLRGR